MVFKFPLGNIAAAFSCPPVELLTALIIPHLLI